LLPARIAQGGSGVDIFCALRGYIHIVDLAAQALPNIIELLLSFCNMAMIFLDLRGVSRDFSLFSYSFVACGKSCASY